MNIPRKAAKLNLFNLQPPKYGAKWKKALFVLEITLSALIIAIICTVSSQGAGTNPAQAQAIETDTTDQINNAEIVEIPDQIAEKQKCDHLWIPITYTLDHPQVSHEVRHEATYENTTVLHTICNECNKVIDGAAQLHIDNTGHSGFTVSVPVSEKALTKEAWIETVIDEQAWTETIINGYRCSRCNTESDLSA